MPGVLGGVLLLLLPPPQATMATPSRASINDPKASFHRRRLVGTTSRKKAARIAPPSGSNQRGVLYRPIIAEGAVVFTVSVVVLPGVMEEEASEQLPSIAAGTEQLKLTELLKPLTALIPIVVVPDAPGDEILNEAGLGTMLKSAAPFATVMATGEVVVEAA